MPKPPHRAYELTLKIGADDWPAVLHRLEDLVAHVRDHGPACDLVSGSYDSDATVQVEHRPAQTHERYAAELAACVVAERAADETKQEGI